VRKRGDRRKGTGKKGSGIGGKKKGGRKNQNEKKDSLGHPKKRKRRSGVKGDLKDGGN